MIVTQLQRVLNFLVPFISTSLYTAMITFQVSVYVFFISMLNILLLGDSVPILVIFLGHLGNVMQSKQIIITPNVYTAR